MSTAMDILTAAKDYARVLYQEYVDSGYEVDKPDCGWAKAYWNRDTGDAKGDKWASPLEVQVRRAIDSWRRIDPCRFAAASKLTIWRITDTCRRNDLTGHGYSNRHIFVIEPEWNAEKYVIQMWLVEEGDPLVALHKNAIFRLCKVLDTFVQTHVDNDSYQAWLGYNGKHFGFLRLPWEMKWTVFEAMMAPCKVYPFRGFRSLHCIPDEYRLWYPNELKPLFLALSAHPRETELLEKVVLSKTTFCFGTLRSLEAFIHHCPPHVLQQVRHILLAFSHATFLSLWRTPLYPGCKVLPVQESVEALKTLRLWELILEFRPPARMRLHNSVSRTENFGCHAKTVDWICHLVARHARCAKDIRLSGLYFRPSQQAKVRELHQHFLACRRKEEQYCKLQDLMFKSSKDEQAREQEYVFNGKEGVPLPKNMTGFQPVYFEDDVCAEPDMLEKGDGVIPFNRLWPCHCPTPCTEDYFDNRDPPPSWKPHL